MKTQNMKPFVELPDRSCDAGPMKFQAAPTPAAASKDSQSCCASGPSSVRQGPQRNETASARQSLGRPIETLLVEPNGLFREGLGRILAETVYCPAVSAAGLDDVRSRLESGGDALLLIVDSAVGHPETGREIRMLKERNPSLRIVLLVEQYDLGRVLAAFEAGAAACLVRSTSHEALVKTLDLVMLGETIVPGAVLAELQSPARFNNTGRVSSLSARERAILEYLTEGAPNKVIARKLDISEATVKVHVKTILRKLRAKNRTQAALWASAHMVTRRSR